MPFIAQRRADFCLTPAGVPMVHRFHDGVTCTCGARRWSEWFAELAWNYAEAARS